MRRIEWCPGCGNYSILKAFKNAVKSLEEIGIERGRIVVASGIGCHGRITDYIELPSFHVIHGRVLPFLTGLKLANRDLIAIGFAGDGDAFNEGMEHFIHAAKRNTDVSYFVHNNNVFALTKGHFTATTPRGMKTRSTPKGNFENPINPVVLAIVSGATFVARGFAGNVKQLENLMLSAMLHRGFSFIEIIQPCVSFNNTWEYYRKNVKEVGAAKSLEEAIKLGSIHTNTGVIYVRKDSVFEDQFSK